MKTKIDAEKFLGGEPILATVEGQTLVLKPKKFSSGSLGYSGAGKVTKLIDGVAVQIQVTGNWAICGTKPE